MGLLWKSSQRKNAQGHPTHDAGQPDNALASRAHWLEVGAVAQELKTARPDGLQEDEANRRLEE
jgi:hypothetical protein